MFRCACRGFEQHVGRKTTFRVINHEAWAMGLKKLVESDHERLLIRDVLGNLEELKKMMHNIKNPVYLLQLPGGCEAGPQLSSTGRDRRVC